MFRQLREAINKTNEDTRFVTTNFHCAFHILRFKKNIRDFELLKFEIKSSKSHCLHLLRVACSINNNDNKTANCYRQH